MAKQESSTNKWYELDEFLKKLNQTKCENAFLFFIIFAIRIVLKETLVTKKYLLPRT